jgi:dienelactone hydrolase
VGIPVVAALLMVAHANAAGRAVAFQRPDGRLVTGFMIDAPSRPAPAVVLVPMLGRPKEDWEGVAQRLASANISALAIDLPALSMPPDPRELAAWHHDVLAAVAYLAGRPADVRSEAIGLAGASLGASLAALAAAADPAVRSLALVSPSLDYRGVRMEAPMRQYGARPALLVASLHDPYAARSVRELVRDAAGPRQARWSDTPAHGASLLARDPDLAGALVEWFQLTLGVN